MYLKYKAAACAKAVQMLTVSVVKPGSRRQLTGPARWLAGPASGGTGEPSGRARYVVSV